MISQRLNKIQDKLEFNNVFASALLSMLFILTTYGIEWGPNDVLWWIELILVCDLSLDWLFFLLMADNRLAYLFKV